MSVNIECTAEKFSISNQTGIFANWKRRRFTLCGCVLTYFNNTTRAGGLVISKDTKIISDPSKSVHPQSRDFTRELLIDYSSPGETDKRLHLLIRFDNQETKNSWEMSLNNLVQFLNI